MSIALDVAERLSAMPEASAIAIRLNVNTYFDVIQGIMDNFAAQKQLQTIYITATLPSQPIIEALEMLEIDLTNVHFIDSVANILMSKGDKRNDVFYVESPTMLENLILKVEYLLKKTSPEQKTVVLLDAINSLAIHNNPKILSEFMHILVNNLRSKHVYTIILSLSEHSNQEIDNMTSFVCDDTIIVEEPAQEPIAGGEEE